MNCKNCKHFTALKKELDYAGEFNEHLGNCAKIINTIPFIKNNYSGVSQILFKNISEVKQNDSIIEVSQWGDETQCLVGENFGCIHFSEKQ